MRSKTNPKLVKVTEEKEYQEKPQGMYTHTHTDTHTLTHTPQTHTHIHTHPQPAGSVLVSTHHRENTNCEKSLFEGAGGPWSVRTSLKDGLGHRWLNRSLRWQGRTVTERKQQTDEGVCGAVTVCCGCPCWLGSERARQSLRLEASCRGEKSGNFEMGSAGGSLWLSKQDLRTTEQKLLLYFL